MLIGLLSVASKQICRSCWISTKHREHVSIDLQVIYVDCRARTVDDRIMCHGIISSCQPAATSEIVEYFRAWANSCKQRYASTHHHHHDAKTAEVRCDDSPWWPWSCAFFHCHLILSGDPLPICMIQELRGRPGGLRQTASGWYPELTAITCFRIWCSGVVASNLATCPNSMWRLLIIVSVMFGRPVWTATSEFLTW